MLDQQREQPVAAPGVAGVERPRRGAVQHLAPGLPQRRTRALGGAQPLAGPATGVDVPAQRIGYVEQRSETLLPAQRTG